MDMDTGWSGSKSVKGCELVETGADDQQHCKPKHSAGATVGFWLKYIYVFELTS